MIINVKRFPVTLSFSISFIFSFTFFLFLLFSFSFFFLFFLRNHHAFDWTALRLTWNKNFRRRCKQGKFVGEALFKIFIFNTEGFWSTRPRKICGKSNFIETDLRLEWNETKRSETKRKQEHLNSSVCILMSWKVWRKFQPPLRYSFSSTHKHK